MDIIFLGNKLIGRQCLDFLITNKRELNIRICAVFTKKEEKDNEITLLGSKHKIPTFHDISQLNSLQRVDFIISVQYHRILTPLHLSKSQKLAVNLHMAPLPEYRGCNQFSLAIINRDIEFGVTLHRMDPGIDSGPIIDEIRFPIPSNATVSSLFKAAEAHSLRLFKKSIPKVIESKYTLTDQGKLKTIRKSSFHLRKEIEELKQIDLNWNEEKIDRYIRALSMPGFPPPYTIIKGRKIYLTPETDAHYSK